MVSKVKFDAKQEYEFVGNFKVLQDAFNKHGIDKPIPVDRLMKCKFQDNLEFLQWIKKYWEANAPQTEYNAAARRKGAPGAASASTSSAATTAAAAAAPKKPAAGAAPVVVAKPTPAPAPAAGKDLSFSVLSSFVDVNSLLCIFLCL